MPRFYTLERPTGLGLYTLEAYRLGIYTLETDSDLLSLWTLWPVFKWYSYTNLYTCSQQPVWAGHKISHKIACAPCKNSDKPVHQSSLIALFPNESTTMPGSVTKTCLYNFDPIKPHFYIVKLGFTGVYIIFLISAKKIDFGYPFEPPRRGGSNEYHNLCFELKYEKYQSF